MFISLLILYFFEGISVAAGMLTPLFTFGLATGIGILFGFSVAITILFIVVNIIIVNGTVSLIKNIYEVKSQID